MSSEDKVLYAVAMKKLTFIAALLWGHRCALACFADLTILAAFVGNPPFALVLTEGGEVPFYWIHAEKGTRLLPIYTNRQVLGGANPPPSERRFLEKSTPVLLSQKAALRRLETGTLTWKAEEEYTAGQKAVVGGYAALEGRGTRRVFHFDAEATRRLKQSLGSSITVEPFVSPRELVSLIDASQWKAGHRFIVDRDLLPLEDPIYRTHLVTESSMKEVGSLRSRQNPNTSAITLPLAIGATIAFSKTDVGHPLPSIWPTNSVSPALKLEYLEVLEDSAASLGYPIESLRFPEADRCVGWLLGD